MKFQSLCIFSCILTLLIILIKPRTTKAQDRRASGDCGTSGYYPRPERSAGGHLVIGLSVCPSVHNSVPLTNKVQYLKLGWWYSNQTWTVGLSIGSSHFHWHHMPLGVGWGQNVGIRDFCHSLTLLPPGASVFHKHMSSLNKGLDLHCLSSLSNFPINIVNCLYFRMLCTCKESQVFKNCFSPEIRTEIHFIHVNDVHIMMVQLSMFNMYNVAIFQPQGKEQTRSCWSG